MTTGSYSLIVYEGRESVYFYLYILESNIKGICKPAIFLIVEGSLLQ